MDKDTKRELNPEQELFCRLYATEREFFGNGVQAYIEAYDIDTKQKGAYDGARSSAYRLLTNAHILKRINELLEVELNDVNADRQLAFLMEQDADFRTKLGAIREYNKLKLRIQNKLDITSQGEKINLVEVKFVGGLEDEQTGESPANSGDSSSQEDTPEGEGRV